MFKSSSEPRLARGLAIILGGLTLSGFAFFVAQNGGVLPGGEVAPVKVAWLACAILFWYLLPGLMLLDGRLSQAARIALMVLLANMLLRAAIELTMMYITGNWHPWMGIGHDVFSFVLMLAVLKIVFRSVHKVHAGFLAVVTAMFIPETGFAWYMLTYATDPGGTVYFVSGDPRHSGIMILTSVCVGALMTYLIIFSRQWLYGQTPR